MSQSKTTLIHQARCDDRIPYDGQCSQCGEQRVFALPQIPETMDDSTGKWIRCRCGKIGFYTKADDT